MSETGKCGNCRHHLLLDGSDRFGSCKRFPPALVPAGGYDGWRQMVPQVTVTDWCGEWAPRPAAPCPTCATCNGSGQVPDHHADPGYGSFFIACPACGGVGRAGQVAP